MYNNPGPATPVSDRVPQHAANTRKYPVGGKPQSESGNLVDERPFVATGPTPSRPPQAPSSWLHHSQIRVTQRESQHAGASRDKGGSYTHDWEEKSTARSADGLLAHRPHRSPAHAVPRHACHRRGNEE